MKVKELIEYLHQCDPEKEVYVPDSEYTLNKLKNIGDVGKDSSIITLTAD